MKMVMLDTNILIDLAKKRDYVLPRLNDFAGYTLAISHIVYVEFMAGTQVHGKKDARKFLRQFKMIHYDAAAQTVANAFANKYFTGRENKPMDLLIAAHAKSLGLGIITANSKDFIFSGVTVHPYLKGIST